MIFPNSENLDGHDARSMQVAESRHQPSGPAEEPNSTVSKKEMRKEVWGIMESCIWQLIVSNMGQKLFSIGQYPRHENFKSILI